ncbi:MAG: hypothetical protein KJ065_27465 [Anaerolineae bacterium]|nr:hypothetical protein [Anaerolineae bacterium]
MKSSDWQKLGLEPLPSKTLEIMRLISEGFSYDDMVNYRPQWTYADIRSAAEQVIALSERIASIQVDIVRDQKRKQMDAIKATYPRAYTPWTDEDIRVLTQMRSEKKRLSEMSQHLKRERSAVVGKLYELGLITKDTYPYFKNYIAKINQGKKR